MASLEVRDESDRTGQGVAELKKRRQCRRNLELLIRKYGFTDQLQLQHGAIDNMTPQQVGLKHIFGKHPSPQRRNH